MAHNFIQLNQDKTEVLIVGVKAQREHLAAHFNSGAMNIAKVRPFLSQADTARLIYAFITSRLDYCNALLSGHEIAFSIAMTFNYLSRTRGWLFTDFPT
jgi:hypothetical protein